MTKKEEQPKGDLVLAVCSLGVVRVEHEMAMCRALWPMNRRRRYLAVTGFDTASLARNVATHLAKEGKAAYLFFWDDDIVPRDVAAVQKMVYVLDQRREVDVVGGVYARRTPVPEPIVAREYNTGAWWGWQDGKIHKVYLTGTGFMAIRVSSLGRISPQTMLLGDTAIDMYFREGKSLTDDFFFADLCKRNGLTWYVHGEIICDHIQRDTGEIYRVEDGRVEAISQLKP